MDIAHLSFEVLGRHDQLCLVPGLYLMDHQRLTLILVWRL